MTHSRIQGCASASGRQACSRFSRKQIGVGISASLHRSEYPFAKRHVATSKSVSSVRNMNHANVSCLEVFSKYSEIFDIACKFSCGMQALPEKFSLKFLTWEFPRI